MLAEKNQCFQCSNLDVFFAYSNILLILPSE